MHFWPTHWVNQYHLNTALLPVASAIPKCSLNYILRKSKQSFSRHCSLPESELCCIQTDGVWTARPAWDRSEPNHSHWSLDRQCAPVPLPFFCLILEIFINTNEMLFNTTTQPSPRTFVLKYFLPVIFLKWSFHNLTWLKFNHK